MHLSWTTTKGFQTCSELPKSEPCTSSQRKRERPGGAEKRKPSESLCFDRQQQRGFGGSVFFKAGCFCLCFLAEGDLLHLIRERLHSKSLTEYYTSIGRVPGREPFARSDFIFPPYSSLQFLYLFFLRQ